MSEMTFQRQKDTIRMMWLGTLLSIVKGLKNYSFRQFEENFELLLRILQFTVR